jgi:hypothetical protein
MVEHWFSSAIQAHTTALKSSKLATFPKVRNEIVFIVSALLVALVSILFLLIPALQYLVFQINKFYADVDWSIKKRGLRDIFIEYNAYRHLSSLQYQRLY